MAFHVDKLPLASLPCFCTILLIICSLVPSSQAKSCKCGQEQRDNFTMSSTFEQMNGGLLCLVNSGTRILLPGSLGSYMKNSSSTAFNLSDTGFFIIPGWIHLWEESDDGTSVHEASLSIVFTLNIHRTQDYDSRLVFAVLPGFGASSSVNGSMPTQVTPLSLAPTNPTLKNIAGSLFSVQISAFNSSALAIYDGIVCVQIATELVGNFTTAKYSVWIDYDRVGHHLLVYIDAFGNPKPVSAIADLLLTMSDTMPRHGVFGFFSSMGQLLQLQTWHSTVEQLPMIKDSQAKGVVILSSVLGSAASTAIVATAVYFYFNSKYRRWKMDLDQLAKSMQRLPGVPTQVNFVDIKKATNNFHETMRLGSGGFGAVYRCSLPAPKKGEMLEAAVKKFTRDDKRRYEDFLSEVSIINRLRHKNIVPLIGWSYNRGEPLLIYEYMPNGSLDQHLFRRRNDQQQQQSPICQWETRYNIIKDVATGLQYVHHEYDPVVLHRDIKPSNIMLDSTFRGRLGDFGLACVVADGKNSYTDHGAPGTPGFMAHEYIHSWKATTKTDIFAFGVLILQIVTGKPAVSRDGQFGHITDWVWHLHREGNLLDAVDTVLIAGQFDNDGARRLLLLGLACSNPNPSDRPSMVDALHVITNSAPPPDVPLEKPRFVWPPDEWGSLSSDYSTATSNLDRDSVVMVEMAAGGHVSSGNGGNSLHHRPMGGPSEEELFSVNHITGQ
ncbi:hypothetical protein ACP70R_009180 [Stipagrostis hirtigluma subsp. patula]